ncbi:MAG TPA: hypothetical protein VGM53_33415 [Streptosporangiaceae bacterium]
MGENVVYKPVAEEWPGQGQSAIKKQVPHAAVVQGGYGVTRVYAWRDVFQGEGSRAVSARYRLADTPIGPQYGIRVEPQPVHFGGFGRQRREAVVIEHVGPCDDRPARLQRGQPWAEQYPCLIGQDADLNVQPGCGEHGRATLAARGRVYQRDDHTPDTSGDQRFAAWWRAPVVVARLKRHHRRRPGRLLSCPGESLRFGVRLTLTGVPAFPG